MKTPLLKSVFLILLAAAMPVVSGAQETRYEANWASLDKRPTPVWFTDAKFGVFIHWGVYSVPAWGKVGEYAEWYWRRVRSEGAKEAEWRQFHAKNYGEKFDYMDFAPQFTAELFKAEQWARVFKQAGVKYVVITSKHHEGFALWPSAEASRTWGRPWNAAEIGPKRDLLGELAAAGPLPASGFEEIRIVGVQADRETHRDVLEAVVMDAEALKADALPEKARPAQMQLATGQRRAAIGRHVGIGQIDREERVVLLHRRAQQQRALRSDRQLEAGQEARPFVVEALGARQDGVDVAVPVEHGEGFALFEHLHPVVGERGRREDVKLIVPANDVVHR